MIKVTLKDDVIKEFESGVSAADVAKSLGMGLYKSACACKINGVVCDLRTVIENDCSLEILTFDNTDGKSIDDIIDLSGYNVGDTAPGALVQIIYQAKVSEDKASCNKSLKNTIHLSYNSSEQKQDDATVIVTCDDEPEPDEPGSTCETNPEMDGCSEEKNCITNPEMEGCKELPNTGPMEIIMATVIVIGICGGGYYLYRTQKTLKTVEGNVVSKKTDKMAPENKDAKGPKTKKPEA